MRVLIVDNYDSFTYNLVQYLGELGAKLEVVRNDAMDVDAIARRQPERIVISPGPCTPIASVSSISDVRDAPVIKVIVRFRFFCKVPRISPNVCRILLASRIQT